MQNNNIGKCGHAKCAGGDGTHCYEKGKPMATYSKDTTPEQRLEELRTELRAERISYGELAELQELAPHIQDGDVELLEAAGVPEFKGA